MSNIHISNISSLKPSNNLGQIANALSSSAQVCCSSTSRSAVPCLTYVLGWAGYTLARDLDPKKYQVVVVSPRSYFVFTPLLASTSTGTLEFRTALEPVRSRRTKVEFFQGWADSVDFAAKTLSIEEAVESPWQGVALAGDGSENQDANQLEKEKGVKAKKGKMFEMSYDKLVVAVGCYSQTFGTPGVKENAYFLKDVGDARKIRNRMLSCELWSPLMAFPISLTLR